MIFSQEKIFCNETEADADIGMQIIRKEVQ